MHHEKKCTFFYLIQFNILVTPGTVVVVVGVGMDDGLKLVRLSSPSSENEEYFNF